MDYKYIIKYILETTDNHIYVKQHESSDSCCFMLFINYCSEIAVKDCLDTRFRIEQ